MLGNPVLKIEARWATKNNMSKLEVEAVSLQWY
jgi:hypothetical protein